MTQSHMVEAECFRKIIFVKRPFLEVDVCGGREGPRSFKTQVMVHYSLPMVTKVTGWKNLQHYFT